MNNKCTTLSKKTIASIRNSTSTAIRNNKSDINALRTSIFDICKQLSELLTQDNAPDIANIIYSICLSKGVTDLDLDFFNLDNLTNHLRDILLGITEIDPSLYSLDQLISPEAKEVLIRRDTKFLDLAYGSARAIRATVLSLTNRELFDCFILNRGTISNLLSKLGAVLSGDLNRNIKIYQEYLFQKVLDFLKYRAGNSTDEEDKLALERYNKMTLYNSQGNYTGAFENIRNLCEEILSPKVLRPNGNDRYLKALYDTTKNVLISQFEKNRAKLKLDAYNAYTILSNFDSFIKSEFGKIIDIRFPGLFKSENKYKISDKTASVFKTWRESSDIDVEAEADAISRKAIETTPLYYFGTDTLISGRFLSFADFEHIIAKIKDLNWNIDARLLKLDSLWKNGYGEDSELAKSLSKSTLEYLQLFETLGQAISHVREDARSNLRHIFELLSNPIFKDSFSNTFMSDTKFTKDELNKLYSLNRGIFSLQFENSLYTLADPTAKTDFYSYISQLGDTICPVHFSLYYKDEHLHTSVRTLKDAAVDNIRRRIELIIERNNGLGIINDFTEYSKRFKSIYLNGIYEFTIPSESDNQIKVTVEANTLNTTFYKDNTRLNNFTNLSKLDREDIYNFILEITRIDLNGNPEFLNELAAATQGGESSAIRDLLKLSSTVMFNKYISYTYLTPEKIRNLIGTTEKEKIASIIRAHYSKKIPNYDYEFDLLSVVGFYDAPLLKRLATALANINGVMTSAYVRDGLGNNLHLLTLNRLLGNVHCLMDLVERLNWSATRNCALLRIPGLFKGIFTSKEFHSTTYDNKPSMDMNIGEMAYSGFIYDFVGGLLTLENDPVVGNGKVAFMPAVIADKDNSPRMIVDLTTRVKFLKDPLSGPRLVLSDSGKMVRDLQIPELRMAITTELGEIYSEINSNIFTDWEKLANYIRNKHILVSRFDYNQNFNEFHKWWNEQDEVFKRKYGSEVGFVRYYLQLYNQENITNPLLFIDLIHYINKKGVLASNLVLFQLLSRFVSAREGYLSSEEFFITQNAELLKTFLRSGLEINTAETELPELVKLAEHKDWINPSGNMILAKLTDGNKIIPITANRDLREYVDNDTDINTVVDTLFLQGNILLNPLLEKYNLLDFLFTLEFTLLTVGTHIAHPDKSNSSNLIHKEASMYNALVKRNVSYTAAMHAFQLNTLGGISDEYNIAVIEDIHDELGTALGTLNDIKAFDGASFVNPFVVLLENISLGGSKAGITKKQFIHFKNAATATGGIIKTAGFGMTNDWLLNGGLFFLRMMRRMTNRVWRDENGLECSNKINIKEGYKGDIEYNDMYFITKNIDSLGNPIIYKIVDIQHIEGNRYKRILLLVDSKGDAIAEAKPENAEFVINSNYKLWKFFGGEFSMAKNPNTNLLERSNTSVENVVIAMNNIGFKKGSDEIESLKLLYLPLKHSDVHYVVTAGAIKLGAANINSADKYLSTDEYREKYNVDITEEDLAYDILKIKLYYSGILLDKEHNASESELSLMTLVVNACSEKGYTFEAAARLYNALSLASLLNMKHHFKALEDAFVSNSSESVFEVFMKTVIDSLSSASNTDTFATIIAKNLVEKARTNKDIKFADEEAFPVSDPTVYKKIVSIVASVLTNTGIKLKIPGILSVLTPSHNIFKLYDGRKYEWYSDPDTLLAEILKNTLPIWDINDPNRNISRLSLQRTYLIVENVVANDGSLLELISYELINTPWDYNRLKRRINSDLEIVEGYNYRGVTFKSQKAILAARKLAVVKKALLGLSNTKSLETALAKIEEYNKILLDPNASEELLLEVYNYNPTNTRSKTLNKFIEEALSVWDPKAVWEEIKATALPIITKVPRIKTITEWKPAGRNLASFNARGVTTEGKSFQVWDLDSVTDSFDIILLKTCITSLNGQQVVNYSKFRNYLWGKYGFLPKGLNDTNYYDYFRQEQLKLHLRYLPLTRHLKLLDLNLFDNWYDLISNRILKRKTIELANLSTSVNDTLALYDKLVAQVLANPTKLMLARFGRAVNLLLGSATSKRINSIEDDASSDIKGWAITNSHYIYINGIRLLVTLDNFLYLHEEIKKELISRTLVLINNKLETVDKSSVQIEPYELCMPKTFVEQFGLDLFADVSNIILDKDFFIKEYFRNQNKHIGSNLYSIKLVKPRGNHIYILLHKDAVNTGLIPAEIITTYDKGKKYRLDPNNRVMYEMLLGDSIYIDPITNSEVIVTENPTHYLDNLDYFSIQLSDKVFDLSESIIERCLTESNNKVVRHFMDYAFKRHFGDLLKANLVYNKNITIDNYFEERFKNHPIVRRGRELHTSFIKALDVVAARIPALAMQSFMPMTVVAFDNPDINTAHVSTALLLLQGSDFDIDAVSLATYDINPSGLLEIHSPYANLQSVELANASLELTLPTGKTLEYKLDNKHPSNTVKFLSKYLGSLLTYKILKTGDIVLDMNLDTVNKIRAFNNLLADVEKVEFPTQSMGGVLLGLKVLNNIVLSPNQVESIFSQIKEIVDAHNTYLDTISDRMRERIINNSLFYNMYKAASDIMNILWALTSVDATTGPLKEIAATSKNATLALTKIPGNVGVKWENLLENRVGKRGIGICATGLKAFYAITQYGNTLLNNGSSEELGRLLLGTKGGGYIIGDNAYHTAANIRAMDINTITNDLVLAALASVSNDEDASLILSALLSLATDNAKELTLSKINAGTNTIGMYIYGLTIGMDFRDIAKIMMSDLALTLTSLMDGNIFTGKLGYYRFNDSLFKYFDKGPISKIYLFARYKDMTNPVSVLEAFLSTEMTKSKGVYSLRKWAFGETSLKLKLLKLENLRKVYAMYDTLGLKISSIEGELVFNLLIDFVEDYVTLCDVIKKNEKVYKDLKTLAAGAEEMYLLGRILSINLGLKTKSEEYAELIHYITRALYDKTGEIIDIVKFVEDADYREECINKYEDVKHSFNVLDIIAKVPHYFDYIKVLASSYKELLTGSYLFRSVEANSLKAAEKIGINDEALVSKGLEYYLSDRLRKDWMLDNELTYIIPAGNIIYTQSGDGLVATVDTPILLGTDWGDATFRRWLESEVFPNLRKGIIDTSMLDLGKGISATVKQNPFIKDLSNDQIDKTVSGNSSVVYTLPISMVARSKTDLVLLDNYIDAFNSLRKFAYKWSSKLLLEDGSEKVISSRIPLTDLFTYYAMIANSWRFGESSLMPILKDLLNIGAIKNFHDYISSYDRSTEVFDLDSVDFKDIRPFLVSKGSPFSSSAKYIWGRNKNSRKFQLMRRVEKKTAMSDELADLIGLDAEEGVYTQRIGKYEFVPVGKRLDTSLFTKNYIESNIVTLDFTLSDGVTLATVKFDRVTGKIESLDCASPVTITSTHVLFAKLNGRRIPKLENLIYEIENELTKNNCKN